MIAADAQAQDYPHPRQMGLEPSDFAFPDPSEVHVELDNGFVAYVAEDHRTPLATLTAFVRVGTASDTRQGAAEALERALRTRGPRSADPGAFAAALRTMVADYRVSMSSEMTEVSINVPVEEVQEALTWIAGVLREPVLSNADIAALRTQAEQRASPSAAATGKAGPVEGSLAAATDLFHGLLFDGHPYGHHPTVDELSRLTVADVQTFHGQYFVPGNVALAVAGDFDRATLAAAVEAAFSDWEEGEAPEPQRMNPIQMPAPRQVHTYPANKLQGWVVLGHELPIVPEEDQAALEVMNYILGGGHFDTRLFRQTRDKHGLTNDASGFLAPHLQGPGSYTFRTYSRPEVLPWLLEIVFHEINRMRTEPVREEELFVAKGALADGVFEMRFENGTALAHTWARSHATYGDHQRLQTYRQRIRAVTIDDVRAAAQKYLHPERMHLVLVGPIDQVRQARPPKATMQLHDFGEIVTGNL